MLWILTVGWLILLTITQLETRFGVACGWYLLLGVYTFFMQSNYTIPELVQHHMWTLLHMLAINTVNQHITDRRHRCRVHTAFEGFSTGVAASVLASDAASNAMSDLVCDTSSDSTSDTASEATSETASDCGPPIVRIIRIQRGDNNVFVEDVDDD